MFKLRNTILRKLCFHTFLPMILQNLDLVKDLDCRQRLDSSTGRPCCCHECILALLLKCERPSLKKATG